MPVSTGGGIARWAASGYLTAGSLFDDAAQFNSYTRHHLWSARSFGVRLSRMRFATILFCAFSLLAQDNGGEQQAAALRALTSHSPRLALQGIPIKAQLPSGSEIGMVSWIAVDREGLVYLLQRGDKADPIIVLDREGHVVRSWGKGLYTMPHSIRIDPHGDIWTTDAASSMVMKFSPRGKKLLEIPVGGTPVPCRNNFCGTTDTAFAPNGHIFISDGYANARVLEYTAEGKKVREWGKHGIRGRRVSRGAFDPGR